MASSTIMCAVCGAQNDAVSKRCNSCGATLEPLFEASTRREARGFSGRWALIAFAFDAALAAIALALLPLALPAYDPQGLPGVMILIVIAFLGAVVTAFLSPGRTYFEPGVGAAFMVGPALWYLVQITDVRELSELSVIAGGILAVITTVLGANVGEKLQSILPSRS